MSHQTTGKLLNYDIEEISNKLIERLPDVIEELGITAKYQDSKDHLSMPCPIHDGDNPQGFSILKRGIGNWQCFTHRCHEEYGRANGASLISFIQAYRKISYRHALEWAAKFTGVSPNTLDKVESFDERNKFILTCKTIEEPKVEKKFILTRDYLRKSVSIPAEYFHKRGFSQNVLNSYDIGTCLDKTKPYYNRVIVPLYDDDGLGILACTGRSVYPLCNTCKMYHDPTNRCPVSHIEKMNASKWRNTSSTIFESYLYNYWKARHNLINDTLILVEGAPDVWKLIEAGIPNVVALLGTKFTTLQRKKLEESGIINLIIGTDNDEAGKAARERIRKECNRLFNVYDVEPTSKDFGDMNKEEILKLFKEYI